MVLADKGGCQGADDRKAQKAIIFSFEYYY